MKTQLVEETKPSHVLFSRTIRPIRDWSEWLTRWEAAISLEEMMGLLHVGFNVPLHQGSFHNEERHDRADRIIFFMAVADGWSDAYGLLRKAGESRTEQFLFGTDKYGHPERKSEYQLRHLLAVKAFEMLCANFFKPRVHRNEEFREWEDLVVTDKLFPALQNFFRVDTGNRGMIVRNIGRNESPSNNSRIVTEFMRDLAAFLWDWNENPVESWMSEKDKQEIRTHNKIMLRLIKAGRVWIIEVLAQLGELHALQKFMLYLDKDCLDKIHEIAMRNQMDNVCHPITEDRPVVTLDEACYIGSPAAWFLKRHELMLREHIRLTGIKQAEEVKANAQRTIEKLSGKT